MLIPIDERLLRRCIDELWPTGQIIKCMEEAGELSVALAKYLNPPQLYDQKIIPEDRLAQLKAHVIDELADAMICVSQMAILFDQHAVFDRIVFKQNRLQQYLDKLLKQPDLVPASQPKSTSEETP